MTTVTIEVNKRPYRVNCDPGQEDHLKDLGRYIDLRITQLADAGVQTSDINMLLLASLLIADELTDAKNKLDRTDTNRSANGGQASGQANGTSADADKLIADTLNDVAQRIEDIAGRLTSA